MASGSGFLLLLCLTGGLLAAASGYTCPARRCPAGWTARYSRCYMFFFAQKSWIDAERSCLALGGNLASIRNVWEHNFVRDLIFRVSGSHRHTWIGGHDAVKEGQWQWADGSRFSYTRWAVNEPNNLGSEHCLVTNWGGPYWNDWKCSNRNSYICSRDP